MQPTVGRIVLIEGGAAASNGANIAPAIITRVWQVAADGCWLINVMVFPDNGHPKAATSVKLYRDRKAFIEAGVPESVTAAYWPARV